MFACSPKGELVQSPLQARSFFEGPPATSAKGMLQDWQLCSRAPHTKLHQTRRGPSEHFLSAAPKQFVLGSVAGHRLPAQVQQRKPIKEYPTTPRLSHHWRRDTHRVVLSMPKCCCCWRWRTSCAKASRAAMQLCKSVGPLLNQEDRLPSVALNHPMFPAASLSEGQSNQPPMPQLGPSAIASAAATKRGQASLRVESCFSTMAYRKRITPISSFC